MLSHSDKSACDLTFRKVSTFPLLSYSYITPYSIIVVNGVVMVCAVSQTVLMICAVSQIVLMICAVSQPVLLLCAVSQTVLMIYAVSQNVVVILGLFIIL